MKQLIQLREWSGFSQRSIAQASGVNYFRIVRAELGQCALTHAEIERIVKVIELAHDKQGQRIKRVRAAQTEGVPAPPVT